MVSKKTDNEIEDLLNELIKQENEDSFCNVCVNNFVKAALKFDTKIFNATYLNASNKFKAIEFYKKIMLPTFKKIGLFWLTNKMNPAQEHFLSEHIKQKIAVATDSKFSKDNTGPSWLLFLPEGEFHEIGLLFAKFLLVQHGYNVIFLGPNVPYGSLAQVSQNIKIDNTLLFCVANTTKNNLDFTIKYLESKSKFLKLIL